MTSRFVSNAVIVVLLTLAATVPVCLLHAEQRADRIVWEMPLEATIAHGYRYELEVDGLPVEQPGLVFCTPSPLPVTCSMPVPPLTGLHVGRLRAVERAAPMSMGSYSAPFALGSVPSGIVVAARPVPPTPINPRVTQ
jgi:hypothetical protein